MVNIFISFILIFYLAGCATIKKTHHNVSLKENAQFKHSEDVYNNKANTEIRAENLSEKEAAEAVKAKEKADDTQSKGEGQVHMKF
ncbi:MAG: hypothetical protein HQL24_09060 [Candidatus Omnitrophica bacterium]|nr:hypothetical protein [Candidatus Omnitrophota bacterium]